jgi:hypothetical protein
VVRVVLRADVEANMVVCWMGAAWLAVGGREGGRRKLQTSESEEAEF